ncbi:pimeloyl-ACP methyl ester carboxylesterase [Amycolatopsis bartoniae]|uniref:Alpha/beta hydrolase n=1 Tax=Amycolatopsis bartoniae TaxID=941986 RepID=A0A8H9IYL6_9PSEU|nr:alpha/beta hydrolase [Amycolatopsis bartoniae]MBB2933237.1 pimeloyl-ACP methyl ester carboxylesterase [Amycolatopsis bartoniae]TVT11775.1 alpha/beta hydrolase [Amycolatopsis bartoniae]GHF58090.1 alpha/beta hydrolase [Amycolatopsis bartoniae]
MSTVLSADGTSLDYDRYGEGPTVVFVGGATQYRALDEGTTEIARRVGMAGFSAVVYDRRGRGRSGDTAPWALEREVEDLAAIIREIGAPAAVYTSSSGATIGLEAARTGIVSRLALYEPPFFAGADNSAHVDALRVFVNDGKYDEAMRYNLTHVMNLPNEAVEGMTHSPAWPLMTAVAPTLVYDFTAVHDVNVDRDWRARWAEVTVPTIVYSGDQTFPGMPEAADAVAAALPHAERRVLTGQGHGPTPDAIVPVLLDFLR